MILCEVANALTGLLAAELIKDSELDEIWGAVADLPISLHELTDAPGAIRLAIRLGRRSAYDAAYIALAAALDAEVWTLDGPLARATPPAPVFPCGYWALDSPSAGRMRA